MRTSAFTSALASKNGETSAGAQEEAHVEEEDEKQYESKLAAMLTSEEYLQKMHGIPQPYRSSTKSPEPTKP